MLRFITVVLILNFYSTAYSTPKEKIILKLQSTNNLNFKFIQTINDKSENGNCTIKYPKKMFCEYDNLNKKIIVSNGKSLVIKNRNKGSYYIYSLKKTALEFLLDKDYLISKINTLELREIDNKYFYFTISEKNSEISVFFDKKTFNLIGWQTEDIYQNLTITFISSVVINKKIDNNIFILPIND